MNTNRQLTSKIYTAQTNVFKYFTLSRVNDSLMVENRKLHEQLKHNFVNNTISVDSTKDTIDQKLEQVYSYMNAYVVNNTTDRAKNFITIDRGSIHGVKKNMGVFNDKGIVGIVVGVSKDFSLVMSLLNTESRVSVKLKKNEYFGNLEWDEKSSQYCILSKIPNHVKVAKGDTVVTSMYSSFFPADLMVGKIEDFKEIQGSNLLELSVRLSAEFQALNHVYIVNNLRKNEIEALQETVKDEQAGN
jgi:rod shape-determining protein MreC